MEFILGWACGVVSAFISMAVSVIAIAWRRLARSTRR